MDKNVRPQDDLFRFVNGTWLANTPFPAEYASAGVGVMLFEKAQADVQAILLEAAPPATRRPNARLGACTRASWTRRRVEVRGIAPLAAALCRDRRDRRPEGARDVFRPRARPQHLACRSAPTFTRTGATPTYNVAYFDQDGLGMPNRDYYLKTEDTYVEFRKKYVEYLAKLLTLAGMADGPARAAKILELETKLATDQWTPVQNRDPVETYNKHSLESVAKLAPDFDWNAWFAATGLPAGDFIIRQPSYATALGKHVNGTDLAVWKDYLTVRTIGAYARAVAGRIRRGVVRLQFAHAPRHRDAAPALEARRAGNRQCDGRGDRRRLRRAALPAGGEGADGDARQQPARRIRPRHRPPRLDERRRPRPRRTRSSRRSTSRSRYPDKWRDYTGLEIRRDDLVGNVMRANQFEWDWQAARAGKPKDPTEWFMTPQTVNAYYTPTNNEIVFPAAFLQPPFFNLQADDAVNYGAIGAVIGHEISHGFDDRGRQYDGDGNLRDWWTPEDDDKFKAKAARPREAVHRVPGAARPQGQRRADARREHRRPVGCRDRLRRLHALAERRRGAGHRRLSRGRSASSWATARPGARSGATGSCARSC